MDQAIALGDMTAYLRANRSFHFTIYRASGSPVSVALIESLWLQISPYFNLLQGSGNYLSANSSHRMAAEALKRGEADSARAAIRADIDRAFDILASTLGWGALDRVVRSLSPRLFLRRRLAGSETSNALVHASRLAATASVAPKPTA